MNDAHIDIDELERFVLNSPVLSAERRTEIERHLATCPECLNIEEQIEAFYADIEPVDADAFSPEVQRILERTLPHSSFPRKRESSGHASESQGARIIELYPKHRQSHFQQERPSIIALAAQDTDVARRYIPAGTLLSHDEQTILRLTRDNESNRYLLQVHCDSQENFAHVLVAFDSIEGEYVTNEFGEAVIPNQAHLSLREAHAYVRLPMDVFDIHGPISSGKDLEGTHGHVLHITGEKSEETKTLSFEGIPWEQGRSHILALIGEKGTTLLPLTGDTAEIPAIDLDSASTIVVY